MPNRYGALTQLLQERTRSRREIVFAGGAGETRLTYGELYESSLALLGSLESCGAEPGGKVLLQASDNQNLILAFWACLLGGMIPVPLPAGLNPEQSLRARNVWDMLGRPVVLTDEAALLASAELPGKPLVVEDLYRSVRPAALHEGKPDDTAMIQFSSGSTGEPKGVTVTHRNLLATCQAMSRASAITKHDCMLSWLPLTHSTGLVGFHLTPLLAGINQIHMPTRRFIEEPAVWLETAQRYGATFLMAPTFALEHCLRRFRPDEMQGWDLSRIRLVASGGEPVSPDICRAFAAALVPYGLKEYALFPVYGMTEAGLGITFPPPEEMLQTVSVARRNLTLGSKIVEAPDSEEPEPAVVELVDLGTPVPGCEVRVADERDQSVPADTVGHIQIRGATVTPGYYGRPDLTAAARTDDGWFRTGDVGFLRQQRLFVTGRSKDIVFVNGRNVYLQDVEQSAASGAGLDPAALALCACGSAGQRQDDLILFVTDGGDAASFAALAATLRQAVSRSTGLTLAAVVAVDRLPRTAGGKLERYKLGERYRAGQYERISYIGAEAPAERQDWPDRERRVRELFVMVIGSRVREGADFFQMGGDSLAAVMLTALLHEEYNVRLSLADFYRNPTVAAVARCLDSSGHQPPARPYFLFHEQNHRKVFALPPLFGLGVVYAGLAAYLSDRAFCCFDFLVNKERISRYADMTEELEPAGGYVLLGYSGGGNLAFATACELERRGKQVRAVILLDSYPHQYSEPLTTEEAMKEAASYLDDVESAVMDACRRMKSEYIREAHLTKLYAYLRFLQDACITKQTMAADIHLILSEYDDNRPDRDTAVMASGWQQRTRGRLMTYAGFGSHRDMLETAESIFSPGYLPKNVLVIRDILERL